MTIIIWQRDRGCVISVEQCWNRWLTPLFALARVATLTVSLLCPSEEISTGELDTRQVSQLTALCADKGLPRMKLEGAVYF